MGTDSKSRPGTAKTALSTRLSSWKEIAVYLNRDPRTVQIWEKSEGLPVHRLAHLSRSSVYAYTAEIDAWLGARSAERPVLADEPVAAPARSAHLLRRLRLPFLIVLAAVLVACAFVWLARRPRSQTAPTPAILAILPFQNQTSTDDFLADDLTEELIADMGRIGRVPVIAAHSVLPFKKRTVPLRQVAADLHVSLILQGSVAQAGNQTRITVELVNAAHDTHVWGTTYTRGSSDATSDQEDIASQIAIDVTRQISGSVPQITLPHSAVDPKAGRAYLTGRFYWNQRDLPGLQKAIALYGQAISIDPRYVPAYAGLAECYDLMTDRGVLSDAEAFHRAKAAAQTALSLDPSSAEAYTALAFATYRQDWDFARAEQYFQKAIALNPDYPLAHQWYGEFLGDLLRFDQSLTELRRARDLDPLSPMAGADLADGYMHAGRMQDAIAELDRIVELYPDFLPAHLYRISLYTRQGDYASAQNEAQIYLQRTGDKLPLQLVLIQTLIATGHADAAREQARRLLASSAGSGVLPYSAAKLYFATGQDGLGYAALERAFRERSWWLVTMLVDPGFDPVRTQPRFIDLARRVGLPTTGNPPASPNREQASAE